MGRRRGRRSRNRRSRARRSPSRRRNTRTSQGRRAANRSAARSRAQRAAKKRVAARKAAGRKPSGANKSANRAAARARAQAAAKKRIAQKRTISQTKARNQQKMRDAAAARNRAFQQKRAAEAKARQQKAAAKAKQQKAAAAAKQKAAATSRKAAADRARAQAAAKQKAAAAKKPPAAKKANIGPVADGATYAKNLTNYNMKYGKTPAVRAKAYEQSLDPTSFKGLSDGQTFGVGPVASGDAYARGLNTDNKNVENRLRQVRNLASTLTGGLVPGVRKLADKEIADRRVKVAAQRQANFMGRKTGGKGNKAMLGIQPEIIEEELPVENTTVEEANPLADLTNIQQDAYNTALENYNAGTGYSGQGEGTGFGGLSQAVIAALMAGNRGQKRFRYGTARKRGSDSLLTRGSERFKGFTTTGQLNI